jgi:hypothetical protein
MKKHSICTMLFALLMAACSGKEEIEKFPPVPNRYNPGSPVAFDVIKPTYGGIDKPFVVEGNFRGDISDMKVYFGESRATLLRTDGRSISGLVPKQPDGWNPVSVVIGNDSLYAEHLTFKYSQTRSVSTVAGVMGSAGNNINGDLNTARFEEVTGVAVVKGLNGDNIVVGESWWQWRLRFISLDDNTVITLNTGISFGTPAVDNTGERFYAMGIHPNDGGGHTLFMFERSDGWAPRRLGLQLPTRLNDQDYLPGYTHSVKFAGDNNRYLYTMDVRGNMVYIDLDTKEHAKLKTGGELVFQNIDDRSHLAWSRFHKCFFASVAGDHGIYRIYNRPDKSFVHDPAATVTFEKYAGFNGSGGRTGHRLNDAQFMRPYGLTVTDDGVIYVVMRAGHNCSRVIRDQVELVAGLPGSWGHINGDPLEARFNQPQDICVDSEGNFYIAGGMDRTVRKLTIE